jgi:hypothetical protein
MSKDRVAEQYAKALADSNLEMQRDLMHPDIVARFPQSGEVIRGKDNYVRMLANYPEGLPGGEVVSIRGEGRAILVTPSFPMMAPTVTVYGGDDFILEGVATYPDGSVFYVVIIIRFQGHLVIEEVNYFAAPFDPPEWRRPYIEH